MKYVLACLFIALNSLLPQLSKGQVSQNVLERVLNVRVNAGTPDEGTATAFTLDVDGREYLITAKHVVNGFGGEAKIDVFVNDKWTSLKFKIYRCDDPIDIAVLVPPSQLTVNIPLSFEGHFQLGQIAYFLGFPYGYQGPITGATGPYPLPFVKRATISNMAQMDKDKKALMLLLDGYNNPGFSGGPIVYQDFNESGYVLKVLAVVSGFIPEVVPTMDKHNIASRDAASPSSKLQPWKIKQNKDGTWFEYVDNGSSVALNTGIVQGYELAPAIDLIRQHPDGPEVKELPGNDPKLP